mmetsp:Transcript_131327/g.366111  ORF Transcript_131327/g.366111 Transcript_131327/m.366111 type:complete len:217 (-) Transcript_131327:131-781(-)
MWSTRAAIDANGPEVIVVVRRAGRLGDGRYAIHVAVSEAHGLGAVGPCPPREHDLACVHHRLARERLGVHVLVPAHVAVVIIWAEVARVVDGAQASAKDQRDEQHDGQESVPQRVLAPQRREDGDRGEGNHQQRAERHYEPAEEWSAVAEPEGRHRVDHHEEEPRHEERSAWRDQAEAPPLPPLPGAGLRGHDLVGRAVCLCAAVAARLRVAVAVR